MAEYDIFREQLALKFPAHGHALWEPSPWKPDRPVEVGDVGFIRSGRFHNLFNALRPAEGQSNLPEYYEQLSPKFSDHISKSFLCSNHYCSTGIGVEPEPEYHASGPDDFKFPQVLFRCSSRRGGAVASLPVKARREDTLAKGDFGAWIVKHIDRWFTFARGLGLGIKQMEEIILVTGCDRTRSWTNVTFFENEPNSQATFGVKVVHSPAISIEWHSSPEHVQGAVLNQGPDGTDLPEDQCVFIRGFRVARTFRILPKHLKAAGGPKDSEPEGPSDGPSGSGLSPDQDSYNREDLEAVSIPGTSKFHRDPLHILLDYFAESAPDCDRFLIHDDDLKMIDEIGDGTSLEAHAVMDLLRRSNTKIHTVQCDLSHINGNPNSDTKVVRVAMFSVQNWSFAPQSQLPSLAAQSTSFIHAGESSSLFPQTLPEHHRDLFVDGYIAQMFDPWDAEALHVSLLKRGSRDIRWHIDHVTGAFSAPPPFGPSNQHDWVIIDYAVRNPGPVIRQNIWKKSDKVHLVDHEQLCPPIFFINENSQDLGLPLIEAAGGNCMCLRGAEKEAPVGTSAHAQIRINWSGYLNLDWNEQFPLQFPTRTLARETISLETFAELVGRQVLRFMEKAKNDSETYNGQRRYLIGDHCITPSDVILIGATQVSQGIWMPILQLNNEYV